MAKNRIVFSDDFILKDQRIGIGTADPKESLDVVGNATISQNLYIGNSIGIGTTSPKSDFDVNGTLRVSGVSTFSNDVNIFSSLNGNPIGKFNDGGSVELYNDGSKKFETTGVGVSIFNGTSDTATIQGPANLIIDPMPVGVGTTSGIVRIKGDLYVDGTETIINSTTIELADFIVGIASTATSDMLADGAGIKIGPDNTFLYEYNGGTNPSLKSSENLNVASGKAYQIDQTEVLSATTLGTGVTNSSLKTLGTLAQSLDLESGNTYKINNTDVLSSTTLGSGVTASSLTSLGTLIEDLDIESGKVYKINNTEVLSSTTLGSGVTASSLTGLGTLAQSLDLESGNTYKIDNTEVLSSTTLGSGVTQSSLTGVGTLTTLSVSGDVSVADKIVHTGDTDTAIRFPSENTFAIETGGQERIRVTGVGSFGIGTTDPTTSLDINGSIRIRGVFYDELNHPGGAGQVLSATGTGVTWTGFSEISVGNADTLDNLDSTDFLRSNVDDTKTGITTFEGLVDIDANVDIQETLTVGQGVTVTGISTFNDNVDINANVDIQETLTVGQGVTVTGISTFNSNVDINANVDIRDTLTVGQGVTVTGISTFNSNVDIDANVDIQDSLVVGGGLTVTGVSTFASNVDINANVDIRDTLTVGQGVTVTGISTFNSNVDIRDNLIVSGVSTISIADTTSYDPANGPVSPTGSDVLTLINTDQTTDGYTGIYFQHKTNNVAWGRMALQGNFFGSPQHAFVFTMRGGSGLSNNEKFRIGNTGTISFKGDTDTYITGDGSDSIQIYTNSLERVGIDSLGKVGIGTDSPTQLLDVNGDLRLRGGLYDSGINTTGTSAQSLVSTGAGVSWKDSNTIASGQEIFAPASGTPYYITATNVTSGIASAAFNDSTIVIKDSNVGIGTTIPTQTLDVNGTATVRDSLSIGTTTPTAKLTIDVGTGTTAIDVQGSAGQLFSVTNNLTSGSIFSVNDVSGIPSIDVDADGTIQLAPFGSTENVGVGITNPSQKLDVNGGIRLRGALYDFGGNAGGINQSLVSTGTGVTWSTMTLAAAGQQIYEEEASTAYYLVGTKITPSLTGIGTAGFASDTVVLKDSKIGIGTDSPTEKLDVGGNIKILSNGNGASASSYELLFYGTTSGSVQRKHAKIQSSPWADNTNGGELKFFTNTSGNVITERMRIDGEGNVGIGTDNPQYKLQVLGDFAATTKSFVIPHPTKPGMTLRHGNLEGPENAVYVRGKTTESIIKLPDYWTGLVDEETITVNLTPKNDYLHRVVNVSDNQVEIKAVDGEIDCYFMILGERKDVAKLEVEF
jgi:hypothetical protein